MPDSVQDTTNLLSSDVIGHKNNKLRTKALLRLRLRDCTVLERGSLYWSGFVQHSVNRRAKRAKELLACERLGQVGGAALQRLFAKRRVIEAGHDERDRLRSTLFREKNELQTVEDAQTDVGQQNVRRAADQVFLRGFEAPARNCRVAGG
ncbi:MAG TPA: hypothetical protein VKE51_40005 [Vicinamibacterales bacterium]|nr:hypothetical protein [Vicinamibacterales bacterium]